MSISELGSLGEFIGSIAVLVTLVYLVFQLRQNTLSMRSQSRYFVLEALNADMRQVQEREFFEAAERANRADATQQDRLSFAMYINGWLSHLESKRRLNAVLDSARQQQLEVLDGLRVR